MTTTLYNLVQLHAAVVRSMRFTKWSKYRIKVKNFLTTRTYVKWIHYLKLV